MRVTFCITKPRDYHGCGRTCCGSDGGAHPRHTPLISSQDLEGGFIWVKTTLFSFSSGIFAIEGRVGGSSPQNDGSEWNCGMEAEVTIILSSYIYGGTLWARVLREKLHMARKWCHCDQSVGDACFSFSFFFQLWCIPLWKKITYLTSY